MMCMSNSLFLDSSILIEYRKGAKTQLLESIIASDNWHPFISQVVVSEYLFFHLAIFSGKSPLSVKMAGEIPLYLSKGAPFDFLGQFEWISDNQSVIQTAIQLMETYNLLPNDALIIAICKLNDIKYIASYDTDFSNACSAENIEIIQNEADLLFLQNPNDFMITSESPLPDPSD